MIDIKDVSGTGEKPVQVESVNLEDVLKTYSKPMTIEAPPTANFVKQDTPVGGIDDKSDPNKYFQSGAKKGQPRLRRPRTTSQPVNTPPGKNPQQPGITGELITGALFLMLLDLLFPMLIAAINNKFSKTKIKAELLQLDAKQKSSLEPLANEVVKYINITGHPVALFLIAYCGIVGINFAAIKMAQSEKVKI